jgi:hypothetical protein
LQDYGSQSVCASQPVTEQPFDRIGTKLDLDPQVWIDLKITRRSALQSLTFPDDLRVILLRQHSIQGISLES